MAKMRDSKDPMPTANNTQRDGGGNDPTKGGEKHGSGKAERVSASSRFGSGVGPTQPTRQKGDGNTSVSGEMHNSKKAERVPESRRW